MHCTYCEAFLQSGKGLLVTWQDGVPRPIFACATQAFCNERCLYKYLANQLRELQPKAQFLPECKVRILTDFGDFVVRGESWEIMGESMVVTNTGGEIVAEFRQGLVRGVILTEHLLGEEEGKVEQDQTQA